MKITYDKSADALYIYLKETKIVESDENEHGVILDYDEHGDIAGIEILAVSQKQIDPQKFEFALAG